MKKNRKNSQESIDNHLDKEPDITNYEEKPKEFVKWLRKVMV